MRSALTKALTILDEETTAAGLELVVQEYKDGSGKMLLFQPPDAFETLSSCSVPNQPEELLARGRNSLRRAAEAVLGRAS